MRIFISYIFSLIHKKFYEEHHFTPKIVPNQVNDNENVNQRIMYKWGKKDTRATSIL